MSFAKLLYLLFRYLVSNEEYVVLGAEVPDPLKVPLVGHHHPRLSLDRLDHKRTGVRVLQ